MAADRTPSAAIAPRRRVLRWIDSEDTLVVADGCKVCRITQADVLRDPFNYVVSAAGIAHHANDYGDTDCGKDATKEGWWWPC